MILTGENCETWMETSASTAFSFLYQWLLPTVLYFLLCHWVWLLLLIYLFYLFIFQSAHLLQQTGFTTLPNTWDFVWKTSASCWRNQHIWHRVKYQALTKGLNVSVVMAESWEVQCSTVCERILQNIECKSAINECKWLTCTYVHCWCNWFNILVCSQNNLNT